MSANAILDGFPEVFNVDVFQGSSTAPGKIVVDTLIYGSGEITEMPRETTLTLQARNQTFTFSDLRLVKKPRIYGDRMRTVWEDARHKLKLATMAQNFNERDSSGVLYTAQSKTIQELVDTVATATGLTITTGDLPSFRPLAAWRGKRADIALQELLDIAGLRMVYNPANQQFRISKAGGGTANSLLTSEARFRPGPAMSIRSVRVHSAPKTYEARLSATAVVVNQTGAVVPLTGPEAIFDNFASTSNATLRSRLQQTALRLWEVDSPDTKCLLGRRALSVMQGDGDQTYAGARIIKPTLADVPQCVPVVQQVGFEPNPLGPSGGGRLFLSEHPYVEGDGGAIKTTATILVAYYQITDGKFERETVTESVDPSGEVDLDIEVPWIRPVDSSEADVTNAAWATLHNEVAAAIAERYTHQPQHVTVETLVPHDAIGKIGGVRYYMDLMRSKVETSIALNFEPQDPRGL